MPSTRYRTSVRDAGRLDEMFDAARVVPQDAAVADAEPAALVDHDAARLERLGGEFDGLASALHAQIRAPSGQSLNQLIDARLELAPCNRRPHRGCEQRSRQHF